MNDLSGKHIVLGLTGGICLLQGGRDFCRQLIKRGATVQVVMTEAAEQFITPVTMQALPGRIGCTARSGTPASPTTCPHRPEPRG